MIHVYGTSHVSEESFDVIDKAIEQHDPEVIALELDYPRLNSILGEDDQKSGPLFARLIKMFQERVGAQTGVMPGSEMEYAYNCAMEDGREIALVDQDIRVTVQRLKCVRRKEKVRAVISILAGFLSPRKDFDVSTIPEDELIDELIEEMEEEFPDIYDVLMTERNQFIVQALQEVDENREGDVVAFLGAAHVKKVKQMLNEVNSQSTVEKK